MDAETKERLRVLLEPFAKFAAALTGVSCDDEDKIVAHRWGKSLQVKDFRELTDFYVKDLGR